MAKHRRDEHRVHTRSACPPVPPARTVPHRALRAAMLRALALLASVVTIVAMTTVGVAFADGEGGDEGGNGGDGTCETSDIPAPENLTIEDNVSTSGNQVSLTFGSVSLSESGDCSDGTVDHYAYSATPNSGIAKSGQVDSSTTSVVITGLAKGTEYTVEVYAVVSINSKKVGGQVASKTATPLAKGTAPTFATPQRTADGFTVDITNSSDYSAPSFTASVANDPDNTSPQVSVSDNTLTVTGMTNGEKAEIKIAVEESGHAGASATVQGQALYAGTDPDLSVTKRSENGFTVDIGNFNTFKPNSASSYPSSPASYSDTYYSDTTVTASVDGIDGSNPKVSCSTGDPSTSSDNCTSGTITVTGLTDGETAELTVKVDDKNHAGTQTTTITGQALYQGVKPTFDNLKRTAEGFTVDISNFVTFEPGNDKGNYPGDNEESYPRSYYPDAKVTATLSDAPNGAEIQCDGSDDTSNATSSATCTAGHIVVTGLPASTSSATSATVTVTVTGPNHTEASNSTGTGTVLYTGVIPEFGTVHRTGNGYTVQITNYEHYFSDGTGSAYDGDNVTFTPTVTATTPNGLTLDDSENLSISDTGLLRVTGLVNGQWATVKITVDDDKANHTTVSATAKGQALWTGTVPEFSSPSRTADGFVLGITNYDQYAHYQVTTSAGSVSRSGGTLTVTGLKPDAAAKVRVTVSKSGYTTRIATITARALKTGVAPTLSVLAQLDHGFIVVINNPDSHATYSADANGPSGVGAAVSGSSVRVNGMAPGDTATVRVTVEKDGYTTKSDTITVTLPADHGSTDDPTGGAEPPEAPEQDPGSAAATVDGRPVDATTTIDGNHATVTAGHTSMTVHTTSSGGSDETGSGSTGEESASHASTTLRATRGGSVSVSINGFKPGTRVQVWAFSNPRLLDTVTVSANSRAATSITLPWRLAGNHTLVVKGTTTADTRVTLSLGLTVAHTHHDEQADRGAAGTGDRGFLRYTGVKTEQRIEVAVLLLVSGAVMIALSERRRDRTSQTILLGSGGGITSLAAATPHAPTPPATAADSTITGHLVDSAADNPAGNAAMSTALATAPVATSTVTPVPSKVATAGWGVIPADEPAPTHAADAPPATRPVRASDSDLANAYLPPRELPDAKWLSLVASLGLSAPGEAPTNP